MPKTVERKHMSSVKQSVKTKTSNGNEQTSKMNNNDSYLTSDHTADINFTEKNILVHEECLLLSERRHFGLQNFGNTCYMNSALQCLLSIYPLNQFFATVSFECLPKAIASKAYKNLAKYMWFNHSQHSCTDCVRAIKTAVTQKNPRFQNFDQEDAQEFLSCLLVQLNDELKVLDSETTAISELFHGQVNMVVTCMSCKNELRTPNLFHFIPVSIVPNMTMSEDNDEQTSLARTKMASLELTDCLRNFMYVKPINNNYFCNGRCQGDAKALRRLELVRLPPILIIRLERFFDNMCGTLSKRDTLIKFPIDNLDMRRFVSPYYPDSLSTTYDLFGVIDHVGRHNFGHYTALVRQQNQNSNLWRRYNDSNVSEVEECDIVTKNAYILFYARRESL